MTVTPKKLAANRANAKMSTGPRSPAGKRRSAMNGVTHGMFCREIVLPGEDAREFEQFRSAVLKKLSPQDVVELMICDRIVTAQWKLRRLNAREAKAHLVRSSLPIDRARRAIQRDRDQREFTELRWGRAFVPTADDKRTDRVFAQYEQAGAANALQRHAPSEMPEEEAHEGKDSDEQIDRWSRIEQRLELSIHRSLRMLERMRKQSQSDQQSEPAQCPFLPEVADDAVEESNAEEDQIGQSEAKESDQAEPTSNNQEPITNNQQEEEEKEDDDDVCTTATDVESSYRSS
ncbi:MAG: hypothetical protein H7Z14_21475 [Anaerolineae bacterium]|nr:hypothetical protein [Phycisphaerae bacterium]